ncbi:MAG: hypothetical protein Q8M96_09325, partial [Rubrivivax sp.]|nr:hypothetical protein [Rubrivivax sp.]
MFLRRTLLKRHSVLPGFDLALGFALLGGTIAARCPSQRRHHRTALPKETAVNKPPLTIRMHERDNVAIVA